MFALLENCQQLIKLVSDVVFEVPLSPKTLLHSTCCCEYDNKYEPHVDSLQNLFTDLAGSNHMLALLDTCTKESRQCPHKLGVPKLANITTHLL